MKITPFKPTMLAAFALFQAAPVLAQNGEPTPAPVAPSATAAPAQVVQQRTATPALWVVKDDDTTIYLFGTFHLMPAGLNWNLGPVKSAFESADLLKLEIANIEAETPAIQAMMGEKGILPEGQSLTDGLTDVQKERLNRVVGEAGLPPGALNRMRPWMASLVLAVTMVQKLGLDPTIGVDKTLDGLARARPIPVEGFETGAEQVAFIANMSAEQQKEMLLSTLLDWDASRAMLNDMLGSWSKGDANRVGRLISGSMRSQPELARVLLTDRNARWADWISARMATPGTVFVAVGAGHLAGRDSVQAFLRQKGLRATRVANPPRR